MKQKPGLSAPLNCGEFQFSLPEVMYYLYLPVMMGSEVGIDIRLPPNVECCRTMIESALLHCQLWGKPRGYVYLSARKGYATPDNPLNRPGWHCDGFGTNDMNFVWWRGPGTRFIVQDIGDISEDHIVSLHQFEERIDPTQAWTPPEAHLVGIDPFCVHATPIIKPPGCMRQYVKISCSDHKYDLKDNSHNYLFDYKWEMYSRDVIRNDPQRAGRDYVGQ